MRKVRGGLAVHLGPGRRGITCRSGGISGSFRQGIECFERRCCDAGRRKTDLPHWVVAGRGQGA